MESPRLPRFKRAQNIASMQITERDRTILLQIQRHRFLRSRQICELLGGSAQQILRRLQLLFHHGYLERPRAQIDYYHQGGSRHIVYGLGNKGTAILKQSSETSLRSVNWSEKNRTAGRLFLEHALLISDVLVSLEMACRKSGRVRFLTRDEISLPDQLSQQNEPFRWSVTLNHRQRLSVIPDSVFALEFTDKSAKRNRAYFFLEADRGTMPITRQHISQTSFFRKLLAYEATWKQGLHRSRYGFHRFRVLTVTSTSQRAENLIAACKSLECGHGLFLFADRTSLHKSDPLNYPWKLGLSRATCVLLGL